MPDAKIVVQDRDNWGWRVVLRGPKGEVQMDAFLAEEAAQGYAIIWSEKTGIPWEVQDE